MLAACTSGGSHLAPDSSGSATQQAVARAPSLEGADGPLIPRALFGRTNRSGKFPTWMKFAGDLGAGARKEAGVYVSQFYGGQINGYELNNKDNGPPVCGVPGVQDVNGIAIDQTGKLYVPQEINGGAGGGEITVYAPNCGKLLTTLTSTHPLLNAAIDGTTVYGMDNVGASRTLVEIWANGSTSPTGSLSGPTNGQGYPTINGYAVAVDAQHNVFVSVYAPQSNWNAEVIEFPGGQMPGIELTGTLVIGADFPAGVLVDTKANLLVVNPSDNRSLAIYAPPYTGPATGRIGFNGGASYCALNHRETRLYCTDYEYGSVDVYTYPAGLYLYSFTNGLIRNNVPEGMALKPAAPL
jgi:hypothetical protein